MSKQQTQKTDRKTSRRKKKVTNLQEAREKLAKQEGKASADGAPTRPTEPDRVPMDQYVPRMLLSIATLLRLVIIRDMSKHYENPESTKVAETVLSDEEFLYSLLSTSVIVTTTINNVLEAMDKGSADPMDLLEDAISDIAFTRAALAMDVDAQTDEMKEKVEYVTNSTRDETISFIFSMLDNVHKESVPDYERLPSREKVQQLANEKLESFKKGQIDLTELKNSLNVSVLLPHVRNVVSVRQAIDATDNPTDEQKEALTKLLAKQDELVLRYMMIRPAISVSVVTTKELIDVVTRNDQNALQLVVDTAVYTIVNIWSFLSELIRQPITEPLLTLKDAISNSAAMLIVATLNPREYKKEEVSEWMTGLVDELCSIYQKWFSTLSDVPADVAGSQHIKFLSSMEDSKWKEFTDTCRKETSRLVEEEVAAQIQALQQAQQQSTQAQPI